MGGESISKKASIAEMASHIAAEDTVLLGRVTYQEWARYWPTSTDEPYASHINNSPKYVVPTTVDEVDWKNSTLIKGTPAREIHQLKQQPGKNIGIGGSPALVRSLLQADLLDELKLMIHPVVVGRGKRLEPYLAPHEVIVDVAPDLPRVHIDRKLMEPALHNLIHNSATHTPPGTRVRVSAKVEGKDLAITVADRGPGLPAESLSRIFDKYYRAPDGRRGGVGLGLSVVRGLVSVYGGTITAENRTRGGISFTIRLPLGGRVPVAAPTKTLP